jgi:hypothetical protein
MLEGSEENEHNIARIGGKGTSIALETGLGGAVGKLAAGGAKAAKLAGVVDKITNPLVRGAVQGAIGGTAYGAASGAGEALSSGKDVLEGAEQGAKGGAIGGAVFGGLVSPALEKVGSALRDKYVQTFGSEVLGMARPRDKAAWASIIGKEAEEGVEADAAKKFIQSPELRSVEENARKGRYEKALESVEGNLERLRPGREANYAKLEEAGSFKVGKGLDAIESDAFKATNGVKKNPQVASALDKAREQWVHDFSTADAGAVQRSLLRPEGENVTTAMADKLREVVDALPQSGAITRSAIAKVIEDTEAGPDVIRYVNQHVLDAKQGLLQWNPEATIPAIELRAAATQTQEAANQALGMFNQTLHAETKSAVKNAVTSALEDHLDELAAKSPELRKVVDAIRGDDVKFSVLLAAKTGLNQAVQKTNVNELGTGKALGHLLHKAPLIAGALGVQHASEIPEDIEKGNYGRALIHGGEAALGLGIGGAAAFRTASRFHNRLAPLEEAARAGNPKAISLLKGLAARASAAVGTAMSSNQPPAGTVSSSGE